MSDPGLTEATQRVEAWLDDDEALRIPDTEWGRALYADLRSLCAAREDVADRIQQARADALDEHRRRVARFMAPGLVSRATVIADLEDYAARIRDGEA